MPRRCIRVRYPRHPHSTSAVRAFESLGLRSDGDRLLVLDQTQLPDREVWLDGVKQKEVKVDAKNLFTFDNQFMLVGDAITTFRGWSSIIRSAVRWASFSWTSAFE